MLTDRKPISAPEVGFDNLGFKAHDRAEKGVNICPVDREGLLWRV